MNVWDLTKVRIIHELFWHEPFYVILYAVCLISLIVFWKQMKKGRRFFLLFSVICLVLFIYNPVFVNLSEKYLLRGNNVVVRVFLLLPVFFTECYVFAMITSLAHKKNRILSVALTVAITSLLLFFGVTPWNREKVGFGMSMYLWSENLYKIPQEHIDICDSILSDMDGDRAILSMYEMHGFNDIGGTLNYSIRMYTSRIQLNPVMDYGSYSLLSSEDKVLYWDDYIAELQSYEADNTTLYFLFPKEDERVEDLLAYGCYDLNVDSPNYQVLAYTP